MAKTNTTPPVVTFSVSVGEMATSPGHFDVPVEVRVFRGIQPMNNFIVIIKLNNVELGRATTDGTGTVNVPCQIPESNAGKTIYLKVQLALRPEEFTKPVTLPNLPKAAPKLESNKFEFKGFIVTPAGLTNLCFRLIGDRGEAMANKEINMTFEGNHFSAITNSRGHARIELDRLIDPDEKVTIFATADSIERECVLHLHNSPVPTANVTFHGMVARGSFISIGITCIFAFIGLMIGLAVMNSKTPLERLTSTEPTSGIGWIVVSMICIVPFFFFAVNIISYVVSTTILKMWQKRNYERSRLAQTHSSDSIMENLIDVAKGLKKSHDENKKVKNEQVTVSGTGAATLGSKTESLFNEIVQEFVAEGFVHGVMAIFKFFK